MRLLVIAVAFTGMFSCLTGAADGTEDQHENPGHCAGRKDRAGECYKIRGRLRAYEGYPRCRIWPVGSTHLLGVPDASDLPSNVACGNGFEVYADFVVCPLGEVRNSGMQMICVASATNLAGFGNQKES